MSNKKTRSVSSSLNTLDHTRKTCARLDQRVFSIDHSPLTTHHSPITNHQSPITNHQYTLDVAIKASRDVVWRALIEETNDWWLPDFHMVDPSSVVEFDVRPGGCGLVERHDGAFLVWYVVQFYLPDQYKVYLLGNIAPDWGGPSTSNLTLALQDGDGACVLTLSDAHFGRVNEQQIGSLHDGWLRLLSDGLRAHVEARE